MKRLLIFATTLAFGYGLYVGPERCENCEFSAWGLGYLPTSSCRTFLVCQKLDHGGIIATELCCPDYTKWDQEKLSCVWGICEDYYPYCPNTTPEGDECYLLPHQYDPHYYYQIFDPKQDDSYLIERPCAAGTKFDPMKCVCVHGGTTTCDDDPLLYFPFTYDPHDINCHKVQGKLEGDAFIDTREGCLYLDGHGDYSVFGFLSDYFSHNNPEHWTISIWFNQTVDGYFNYYNYPFEGLFGNGDCDQTPSSYIAFGSYYMHGGYSTDGLSGSFVPDDADAEDREYPYHVWCQVSIRFIRDYEICIFLNGKKLACRPTTGDILNTHSGSTVGLTYFGCDDPFFFTGCLDDLMIFDRYVSDLEMEISVFGRDRSPGGVISFYEDRTVYYPYK